MFNEKKGTPMTEAQRNVIAANTKIVGNIESDGDFRIDGRVEGDVQTQGRVVIGKQGEVKGSITCTNADIEGVFEGNLKVSDTLSLSATAQVSGDTVVGKLSVEPGASLNGTCSMKNSVKELNKKQIEKTA
ncbi:polymer-forming cytoskeletal protein [Flavobacteriaceae bacterium]|nr:polymer-forming cytoskeletal protein [Flavobacteriaceae bacterium]